MIELLVVTVIIAILASLLLPALQGARSRANIAVCQSSMKQCYVSIVSYADDYEEYPAVLDWRPANLDAQGKPNDWYASTPWGQKSHSGSGCGALAANQLVALGYADETAAIGCAARPSGVTHSAQWHATTVRAFHFLSPDCSGSSALNYGHGSYLGQSNPLWHQNYWADSPRGLSYRDRRAGETFNVLSCRSYLRWPSGTGNEEIRGIEPHEDQPESAFGQDHQYDFAGKWLLLRRNVGSSDGAVRYLHHEPR